MTILKLLALALTALVVIPGGAHLFELPGKISLDREAYFTVQGIYAGWAWFAVPIFGAIIANAALFLAQRRRDLTAAWSALVSSVLILVTLVVFFAWFFQVIRRRQTGPKCRTTGRHFVSNGSTATP